MPLQTFYQPGDWNAICSMCGREFKASQLSRHWQGMYRCLDCWEPRQPQDFVRATVDNQSVPWSQPSSDINITICTLNGRSSFADYATADCAICDNLVFDPNGGT
jgi:hypothetical protein